MYHIGCNGRRRGEGSQTRKATLRFLRKELMYDIRNCAYIEGQVMGDEQPRQHATVEVGEEGNADRVARLLDMVHASVVEMLYPYTKEELEDGEEIDDKSDGAEEYVIRLEVPETMSRTTVKLLSKLAHEYMVYRALHDWLAITKPEAAQPWLEKAQAAEQEINSCKNCRRGPLTRPARPL